MALNYDSRATRYDGSCQYAIPGCTDSNQRGYFALANVDDGSCVPVIVGCIDPAATNFNPSANEDDGSCEYVILGCTSSLATNYARQANTDDGSCIIPLRGCMSPVASNFDSNANVDGGCLYIITGCTSSSAVNYVSSANMDDGSCIERIAGCMVPIASNFDSQANAYARGSCRFSAFGCTDSTAVNYDPSATADSGNCRPGLRGCMFPTAANYLSEANIDDGSCIFQPIGCTDSTALNYNSLARAVPSVAADDGIVNVRERLLWVEINAKRDLHCADRLTWDTFLTSQAQAYANTCPTQLSNEWNTGGIGEALYLQQGNYSMELMLALTNLSSYSNTTDADAMSMMRGMARTVVDKWYSGHYWYPWPTGNADPAADKGFFWSYFSEMVWKANMRLGCGMAFPPLCPTATAICRYAPGGNYAGGYEANVQRAGTCNRFQGCIPRIPGCMSPTAANYDSSATVEADVVCTYAVPGCTDSTALNYLPSATNDDQSCIPRVPQIVGCTNPDAANFDSNANVLGTCRYEIIGCTDSTALNFVSFASTDDGTCIVPRPGCMAPASFNYDSLATVNIASSCKSVTLGCTDSRALNYLAQADLDDGGCTLAVYGCVSPSALNYDSLANVLGPSGCTFDTPGCMHPDAINYIRVATRDDGSCIILGCQDPTALNYRSYATQGGVQCIFTADGCTDSRAANYVPVASVDDGSCVIPGCTDPAAFNFSPTANNNDGSCVARVRGCGDPAAVNYIAAVNTPTNAVCRYAGCRDPSAQNYNPSADFNDGSCVFSPVTAASFILGCTDSTQFGYNPSATVEDKSCRSYVQACLDVRAVNGRAAESGRLTSDSSLCIYTGCTSSMAQNYESRATVDDGSCQFAHFRARVTALGYMRNCLAYMDEDGDFTRSSGEAFSTSDRNGMVSLRYREPRYVFVVPNETCVDPVSGQHLSVPLASEATALVVSPLTTVAVFLRTQYNMSSTAASAVISQSLLLTPHSVWNYDAVANSFASQFHVHDAMWLVRQMQVANAAIHTENGGLFPGGDATVALNTWRALASMLRDGPVSLTIPATIMQLFDRTSALLGVPYDRSRAGTVAQECAMDNLQVEIAVTTQAASTVAGRRSLQVDHSQVYNIVCGLAGASHEFAVSTNACVNTTAADADVLFGCTDQSATNFASTALINDATCSFVGCTDPLSASFNSRATVDDGSCITLASGCIVPQALNYDSSAHASGTCVFPNPGCMDATALNFMASANVDDHSCIRPVRGCLIPSARNYDANANVNVGCVFAPRATPPPTVPGCMDERALSFEARASVSKPGACRYRFEGCTDSAALNFVAAATEDDGSCIARKPGCMSREAVNYTPLANINDGTCRFSPPRGCTVSSARRFNATAVVDDGSCRFHIIGCTDRRAVNFNPDATADNGACILAGCTDSLSSNFASGAVVDDGSCAVRGCTSVQADNYNLLATEDDGTCNIGGCMDRSDPAYHSKATYDDGSCALRGVVALSCPDPSADNYSPGLKPDMSACQYPGCTQSRGTVNFDSAATFDDGSCRYNSEVPGCKDSLASNFNSEAAFDSECVYGGCTIAGAPTFNPSAMYDDGSCGAVVRGCSDSSASNYMPGSHVDDGSCVYEINRVYGCTDARAINFNPSATTSIRDSGQGCMYVGCTDSHAVGYDPLAVYEDGSCAQPHYGCTDSRASNFDAAANMPCTESATGRGGQCPCQLGGCTRRESANFASWAQYDDGSCLPALVACTDSRASNYVEGASVDSGACHYGGCTNSMSPNFDASATFDSGACISPVSGCTWSLAANYLAPAMIDDGSCVFVGCTDSHALNFDPLAKVDSGGCEHPVQPPMPPQRVTPHDGSIDSAVLLGGGLGGWPVPVAPFDNFGAALAGVGDVDNDSVADMAVGAYGVRGARGAVYMALLNRTGAVRSVTTIGAETLPLARYDFFGASLASAADLDGDSMPDDLGLRCLVVGAPGDDGEAGQRTGAVYVVFLTSEGGIRPSFVKLSNRSASQHASVQLPLEAYSEFGRSVALFVPTQPHPESGSRVRRIEIAVGAPLADDESGAVYLITLELNLPDVSSISMSASLIGMSRLTAEAPRPSERFGSALAWMPDREIDGFPSLCVGAPGAEHTGQAGSVYILNAMTGAIVRRIEPPQAMQRNAAFGAALALGADWDGDGKRELLVGAPAAGRVYIMSTSPGAAARSVELVASDLGLPDSFALGQSVALLGRVNADNVADVALGAHDRANGRAGAAVTALFAPRPQLPPSHASPLSPRQPPRSAPPLPSAAPATSPSQAPSPTPTTQPPSLPSTVLPREPPSASPQSLPPLVDSPIANLGVGAGFLSTGALVVVTCFVLLATLACGSCVIYGRSSPAKLWTVLSPRAASMQVLLPEGGRVADEYRRENAGISTKEVVAHNE